MQLKSLEAGSACATKKPYGKEEGAKTEELYTDPGEFHEAMREKSEEVYNIRSGKRETLQKKNSQFSEC